MNFRPSLLMSRRFRGAACIIFGGLLLFVAAVRIYAASDFNFDVALRYQVESSGSTRVVEEYTVSGNATNKYLDGITLSTPVDDAENVIAVYADGAVIPSTLVDKTSTEQGYSYNYREVTLKFPRKTAGRSTWQFRLSYDTRKLVDTKGAAHTVFVPAIAQNSQQEGSYSVFVSVPKDFGLPHSSGAVPTSEGLANDRATYSFTQADIAKQAIALTFGDSTVYNVNFNFPLRNDSALARTITATLPPDTSSQKVYINSLEPRPKATRLDADGNVLADFTVPPRSTVTVKTDISAVVKFVEYDLASSGTKSDIPNNLSADYTGATHYWQSLDPNIIVKAKQATAGISKVSDQVKALQKVVVDTLTYNDAKIKYNIRQGASKALENPTNAVCLEYSDLMVALLRSQGIPARMPVGYAYTGGLKASRAVSDSLHSWVEAYVPAVGWITVDPTWGEKFDNFGKTDLDHFAFAIWGNNDSSPAAVMTGTSDMGYQYEQAKIHFVGESPKPKLTSGVVARRWVILPFVSVLQYEVSGPEGVAGDNYELDISGGSSKKIDLGSLAPSQKVVGYMSVFGQSYLAATTFDFKQAGSVPTALSSISVVNNYLPMVIIIMLVVGLLVVLLVRWVLKRRRAKADAPYIPKADDDGVAAPARSDEEILKDIANRTKKIHDAADKKAK